MTSVHANISVQRFTWANAQDQAKGLLGYILLRIGPILVDGLTLRRTATGRFSLSYPAKTDRHGDRHSVIRPFDDESRIALEALIIRQIADGGPGIQVAVSADAARTTP